MGQGHSIRRATVEVEGSAADAFAFQQEAGAWVQERLLPELEAVFAALPDTDAHILIDRLEFTLEPRGREWAIPDLRRLKEDLTALLKGETPLAAKASPTVRHSAGEQAHRRLIHFLRQGVFPWSSATISLAGCEAEVMAYLREAPPPDHVETFRRALSGSAARRRWLGSFSAPALKRMAEVFFALPTAFWDAWEEDAGLPASLAPGREASALSARGPAPMDLRPVWRRALIESLAPRTFIYTLGAEDAAARDFLRRLAEEGITQVTLEAVPFRTRAFRSALASLRTAPSPSQPSPATPSIPASGTTDHARTSDPRPVSAEISLSEVAPAAEGIFVAHAGLILTANFLTTFFSRLGLVEKAPGAEGAPADGPKARLARPGEAMALLHFLATGRDDGEEQNLALIKVLCGLPIGEFAEPPASLSETAKNEAVELLQALIGHWSILKSTSPDGLREAFLQRPGKLTFTDRGEWLLQVEQKAYDMVLTHLPWSYAMVKLPWMTHLLRTEWAE